jgi:hypothetical protein
MRLVFDHDITQMLHADDQHPVEQFAAEATAWAFMGGGQLPYCSPANQATSAQCLLWEAMVTQIPCTASKRIAGCLIGGFMRSVTLPGSTR